MKAKEISKSLSNELQQHAVELTSISNQIRIIKRLLENIQYSKVSGDEFAVHHQINSGLLDDVGDSLADLQNEVQRISDALCPD